VLKITNPYSNAFNNPALLPSSHKRYGSVNLALKKLENPYASKLKIKQTNPRDNSTRRMGERVKLEPAFN
jgi:hypothetical protein